MNNEYTTKTIWIGETAGLENPYLRILFDRDKGNLISLYNMKTGVEYLRGKKGGESLFRLKADSPFPPSFAAGPRTADFLTKIIDQNKGRLKNIEEELQKGYKGLKLTFSYGGKALQSYLSVSLPPESSQLNLSLRIENKGGRTCRIRGAFPYLSGVGIGKDRNSDRGIAMYDRGFPGEKAWKRSGGAYGSKVSMQWQCAYDSTDSMGLAIIAKDTEALPKTLSRFSHGMCATYPVNRSVKPGETIEFPDAGLMVFTGSWRSAAEEYRLWFSKAVTARRAPEWVKTGLAVRSSDWFPPVAGTEVESHELAVPKRSVQSFKDMPRLYLDDNADLKEHAMWNSGINLYPESYGPWMSSGFIGFREDLGGRQAFEEGVKATHKIGRKVGSYVAGYGIRKKSPMFESVSWRKFAIINSLGLVDTGGYKKGFFCCHGYKPWQDNIVRTCRMLAESGVDAIRLDELGQPFKPCFNRHHKHENPYDSVKWTLELLKRVRQAVDEINPEINISTEYFNDLFHKYTNGALVMGYAGTGLDAMRVALPSYSAYSYHGGAGEAVLTGAYPERTTAVRRDWPWAYLPSASRPSDYDRNSQTELRWHEMIPSFYDAVITGSLAAADPCIASDKKWKGHLWEAESYGLITGGYDDGSPMKGEQIITIPDFPKKYNDAWEIDLKTLEFRKREIVSDIAGTHVAVRSGLCAIYFTSAESPLLALSYGDPVEVRRGDTMEMKISLIGTSGDPTLKSLLSAPAMLDTPIEIELPGTISFSIPPDTEPGNYYCQLEGSHLPFRRWFKVTE